ncbi:MAG: hypothetical protein AABY64_10340 [Bdellovibrionota bacterium]
MRRNVCFLILSFFLASVSFADLCKSGMSFNSHTVHKAEQVDDFVPYPWGAELSIPWMHVQGLWVIDVNGAPNYYTFEVVGRTYSPDRQLLIKQYDSKSCEIVAIGVGIENDQKTIWALMKPMFLPKAYRLGLRNFSAQSLPKHLPSKSGRVMVMSVSTSGSLKSSYYPVQKVVDPANIQMFNNCKCTR